MLQDRSWLLAPPVGRWLGLVHQLRDELVRAVNRWQCQLRYCKPKEEGPAQLQGPNMARVPTLSKKSGPVHVVRDAKAVQDMPMGIGCVDVFGQVFRFLSSKC